MVEHAICFKCGEEKAHPYDRCGCCKLTPIKEEEKMKSLYLSEYRFSDGDRMEKWLEELESVTPRLQRSEPLDYDLEELKRMAVVDAELKAVPASAAWKALFRFFLPGIILLTVLWGIIIFLRLSK
jgi:hypothetical protein